MENKIFYPRFIFTQVSGVVAGLLGAFMAVKLIYPKMQSSLEGDSGNFPVVAAIIWAVILVISLIGTMKLWGWLLVKIGFPSKEEAKGYPYSKPWKEKESNYL